MPTTPGFASVAVEHQQLGVTRPAYVTFGVDTSLTDPLAVAALIDGAANISGSYYALFDSSVTATSIRVSLGTDGSEDLIGELAINRAGVTTKSSLPPNCALLVHKVTTRGGRRGRGRMFLPWTISENNCDEGGLIDSSTLTDLSGKTNMFLTQLNSAGVPMVVLHQASKPNTAHPTAPGPPNPVTSLVVDKLVSTQRRRLGR
jgi:hypothetical protein